MKLHLLTVHSTYLLPWTHCHFYIRPNSPSSLKEGFFMLTIRSKQVHVSQCRSSFNNPYHKLHFILYLYNNICGCLFIIHFLLICTELITVNSASESRGRRRIWSGTVMINIMYSWRNKFNGPKNTFRPSFQNFRISKYCSRISLFIILIRDYILELN